MYSHLHLVFFVFLIFLLPRVIIIQFIPLPPPLSHIQISLHKQVVSCIFSSDCLPLSNIASFILQLYTSYFLSPFHHTFFLYIPYILPYYLVTLLSVSLNNFICISAPIDIYFLQPLLLMLLLLSKEPSQTQLHFLIFFIWIRLFLFKLNKTCEMNDCGFERSETNIKKGNKRNGAVILICNV